MERKDESTLALSSDSLSNNPFVAGKAYEATVDEDGIVRLNIPDIIPRGVMVVSSPFACMAGISRVRPGKYAEIKLTREWEFVERYEVLASGVADFNFTSEYRGDDDHEYRLQGIWYHSVLSAYMYWRINGQTTGLTNEGSAVQYDGTGATTAGMVIAQSKDAEDGVSLVEATLVARTGEFRLGWSTDAQTAGTGASKTYSGANTCKWEDSTTQITSLGLGFTSNDVLTGSWFNVYRRPRFDKTKITLWVY